MGDWHYYITSLTFEDVAERVQLATSLVTPSDMNYWIPTESNPSTRTGNRQLSY